MALDLSSMWLPGLEMENQGFMNQDEKSECTTDRSFQTSTRFEEHTKTKQRGCDSKASNISISTMCQTPMPVAETSLSVSNTFTISFGQVKTKLEDISPFEDSVGIKISGTGKVQTKAKAPVQVQDHVMAERKRRENLNRHLISLSALLPNLRKMDKAIVLEDSTNYIRELQDRVKELELLSDIKKNDAKEYIIAKRSTIRGHDDDNSSSNETKSTDCYADVTSKSSPEIQVRMSGSSVLVRIQSQKNSSLLVKVLSKMQKLGLSIISSSAMPFANTITLITVVAQGDFFITATDLIKNIQLLI